MRGYRHVIMFIRYENGMYVIDTELDMLWEMKRRYKELYHFNPVLNNMTQNNKKDSRLAGLLGEVIFERLYPTAKVSSDRRYDYTYMGWRIDVKCKLRNVPAHLGLEASIYEYQLHKSSVDIYYFMSTTPDFNRVWLCGWIGMLEMVNHPKTRHWKKGELDRHNNKRFTADTLNLKYSELRRINLDDY